MSEQEPALARCVCGAPGKYWHFSTYTNRHYVSCSGCGAVTPSYSSRNQVIAAWNRMQCADAWEPIAVPSLRRALTDAEHRVQEIATEISEHEHKRACATRLAGALQEKLDWLNQEHAARTAHVRALEALLP